MLRPFAPPLALASLLVGLTATAQAASAGGSALRSIVLTGKAGESPLIYLAPGTFTLIILDAPIARGSVEVEGGTGGAVPRGGERPLPPGVLVKVQVRNQKGKAVLDFKGIPVEQVSQRVEALTGKLPSVRRVE